MFQEGQHDSHPPQLCTGWPVNPHASSTTPHVAFLLPLFFWLSWIFWKCVSDGSPWQDGAVGKVQSPETTECWCQKPPWACRGRGWTLWWGLWQLWLSCSFLRSSDFRALLGPLGCKTFLDSLPKGIVWENHSEPHALGYYTGDNVLGTITRVCDSETLWMGQWVPPSIGPPTSQGQGPLRLPSRQEP